MDAYTRETLIERRQLVVHWSAVFAGALVAAGLWMLLQMLGTGIGLASIDVDDFGALRRAGIGTNAWSIIASLLALFAGGYVATRLSQSRDRTIGAAHGLVTWALTAVFGLIATTVALSLLATGLGRTETPGPALEQNPVALEAGIEDALRPINAHQHDIGKPAVTVRQIVDTSRGVDPDHLDLAVLAERMTRVSSLTQAEALDVWQRAGSNAGGLVDRANRLAIEQLRANRVAARTGRAVLIAGLSLLLGLASALLGALAAVNRHNGQPLFARHRKAHDTHTAPYPIVRD